MAPSKIRRALGAVKDKTSIGLAKVGSSNSLSDLEVAIVKATRHEEYPAEERHVREILSLTCYSRAYISACVNTLSRRLNKTKNWTVALKTLMLIQRLVSEGDPAYEQEIFFSTRRGTRFLNMSDFRDASLSNSWDYSAFVRTYALYLDERLEFRMQSRRGRRSAFGLDEEDEHHHHQQQNSCSSNNNNIDNDNNDEEDNSKAIVIRATPIRDMTSDQIFSRTQHLQQLLERFLACRPTGAAKNNRVVLVALYPIVRESFQIYYDITEIMGILIDRFMELKIQDCVKVYEIFCRVGKQFDELELFYSWCKTIGIARSSEYPEVEKITPKKLEVMDEFIKDRSALAQCQKDREKAQPQLEIAEEEHKVEEEEEEDMNSVKALPPPEDVKEEETTATEVKEEEKEIKDEMKKDNENSMMGDLLNLGEEHAMIREENADKLALALFDGSGPVDSSVKALPWQAFNDESADWESALVQSASNLSNQRADLGGGFDMLLLDGMYKQTAVKSTMAGSGYGVSGSASSMALGSAGRPAMLALPAPPTPEGSGTSSSSVVSDPFAASVAVAPPPYVQMSEMERKQKLLVEEQLMWQQYARDGRQIQHNPYTGGFTHSY
ncbi:hypothetical protein IC582_000290 [Cucumis melo]|uniref:Clathrin assembly protein At1g03050 n=1 Tax=Cucumis melo TaxID=3656 RepID=A0A1S3C1P9_CUCME|nr:putative clathrin assembly protein At1g03050 [Cucumis melo]